MKKVGLLLLACSTSGLLAVSTPRESVGFAQEVTEIGQGYGEVLSKPLKKESGKRLGTPSAPYKKIALTPSEYANFKKIEAYLMPKIEEYLVKVGPAEAQAPAPVGTRLEEKPSFGEAVGARRTGRALH